MPQTRESFCEQWPSVQEVLESIGDFDEVGGASLGLVSWDLCVDELRAIGAWEQAKAQGLLKPAGRDPIHTEPLWQLTPGGWAALTCAEERS